MFGSPFDFSIMVQQILKRFTVSETGKVSGRAYRTNLTFFFREKRLQDTEWKLEWKLAQTKAKLSSIASSEGLTPTYE